MRQRINRATGLSARGRGRNARGQILSRAQRGRNIRAAFGLSSG